MAAVFILFQSDFFSVEISSSFLYWVQTFFQSLKLRAKQLGQFACKLNDSGMVALKYGAEIKHDMEVVRAFAFHRCGLDSTSEPGTVVIFSK